MPKVVVGVDIEKAKRQIQQGLKSAVKGITLDIPARTTMKAQSASYEVFDVNQIKQKGVEYLKATANIVDEAKTKFSSLGQVDITNIFKSPQGEIQSFTASVKKADGTVENYRQKLVMLKDSAAQFKAFIPAGSIGLDKTTGTELQKNLNFLSNIETRLANITSKTTVSGAKPLTADMPELALYTERLQQVTNSIQSIRSSNNVLSDEHKRNIQSMVNDLQRYARELQTSAYAGNELKAKSFAVQKEQLLADYDLQIKKWSGTKIFTPEFEQEALRAKELLNSATDSTSLDKYIQKMKLLKTQFAGLKLDNSSWGNLTQTNTLDTNIKSAQERIKNLKTTYGAFVNDPQLVRKWQRLFDQSQIIGSQKELTNLNSQIGLFEQQLISAGKHSESMFSNLAKNFSGMLEWMVMGGAVSTLIGGITGVYKNTVNLDKVMVELKKVTNETSATYNMFLDNASARAVKLGTSLTDLVKSTGDFARLGFSMNESTQLAEYANVFYKVGDEVKSVDDATKMLVSTMKAYGIEASNAKSIIDKLNEVGNKFAISSGGIGEALTRSASSLAAANNTLDESIALIVSANDVVQDPDAVGVMWKTVGMRIRGVKTELEDAGLDTEGMAETTAKLRDEVKALTNIDGLGGLDILADDDTFKSTYDIITGISKVWKDMSDVDQAALLELIAGKRQGNQVAAAITNIDDAVKALKVSSESAGSAYAEHSKWMEGIEAKQQKLSAQSEQFAHTFLDSDLIKGVFDTGTGLLGWLTETTKLLGALPVLLGAIGGLRSIASGNGLFKIDQSKNWGGSGIGITNSISARNQLNSDFKAQIETDYQALKQFETAVQSNNYALGDFDKIMAGASSQAKTYATVQKGATGSAMAFKASQDAVYASTNKVSIGTKAAAIGVNILNTAMNILTGMLVGAAINLGIKLLDNLINAASKASEKADEAAQKQRELAESASEATAKLTELIGAYEELRGGDGVTFIDPDALSEVEEANSALKSLKERMIRDFQQGNVDLTLRPQVQMGDQYATLLSSFKTSTKNGKTIAVHYTPILDDSGKMLSSGAIDEYIRKALSSSDILSFDKKDNGGSGVVLRVAVKADDVTTEDFIAIEDRWDESLHEIQEKYYDLLNSLKNDSLFKSNLDAETRAKIKGIQSEIVALVGDQANNIDLVNGKLDEELKKLKEIALETAASGQDAYVASYHSAKTASDSAVGQDKWLFLGGYDYMGDYDDAGYNILKDVPGKGGESLVIKNDAKFNLGVKTSGSAEERIEQLNTALDALKAASDYDYSNSDLAVGIIEAIAYFQEYVDRENDAAQELLKSTLLVEQSQLDASGKTVNSTKGYEQYRQSLIDATMANAGLSSALENGNVTLSDVENSVDDLMAKNLPDWYNQVHKAASKTDFGGGSSFENIGEALKAAKTARDTYSAISDDITKSDDGTISLDKLMALISAYPELKSSVSDYLSGATKEEDILDILAKKYKEAADAAGYPKDITEELATVTSDLTDKLTELSNAQSHFDSLSKALGEFSESGIVGADTLVQLQSQFGKLDGFEDFASILGNSSSSLTDVQNAVNKLGAEYLLSNGILKDLNEDTKAMTIADLEHMGVTNAEEVVTSRLTATRLEAELSARGLSDATWYVTEAALAEAGASTQAIAALQGLRQEHYNTKLAEADFTAASSDVIDSLLGQAQAAGAASNNIAALNEALGLKQRMEAGTANPYEEAAYKERMKGYQEKAKADLSGISVNLPQVRISAFKSSGGKNSVEEYIAEIDKLYGITKKLKAVQDEISKLEAQTDLAGDADYSARIEAAKRLAELTLEENDLLHQQSELRRQQIGENANVLRKQGFAIDYDPEANNFVVRNMEHLNKLYGKSKEETIKLRKEAEALIDTTESLNDANIDSALNWYKNAAAAKEYKKSIMEIRQEQADEWVDITKHSIDLLENYGGQEDKMIAFYQRIQEYAHNLANEYRAMGYSEDSKEIRNTQALWWDSQNSIDKLRENAAKKQLDSLKKEQEALQDIFDLTKDMIKRETNDHIDALTKSKDLYRDIVDLKIKSLELTEKEHSYQENVDGLNKDISKLQGQIDSLSLDDSREAQLKRAELLEQLQEKQKELSDTQHDFAVDNAKDALNEEYDMYSDTIDDKIDSLKDFLNDNERLNAATNKRIQDDGDRLYDNLLIYSKKYTDTSEADLKSMWDEAMKAAQKYGDFVAGMKATQDAMDYLNGDNSNIVDDMKDNSSNWKPGRDDLVNDNTNKGEAIGSKKDPYGYWWTQDNKLLYGSSYYSSDAMKKLMQQYSSAWKATNDGAEKAIYEARNSYLGSALGATRGQDGRWYKDGVPLYHTGGVIGANPSSEQNDILMYGKKNELVLTEEMQSPLLKLIDISKAVAAQIGQINLSRMLSTVQPKMAPIMPNIGNIMSTMQPKQYAPVEINFTFKAEGNIDEKTAHLITRTVVSQMDGAFGRTFGKRR